jgi:hypothetical protein
MTSGVNFRPITKSSRLFPEYKTPLDAFGTRPGGGGEDRTGERIQKQALSDSMETSSGVGVNGRYYGVEWGRNDNEKEIPCHPEKIPVMSSI